MQDRGDRSGDPTATSCLSPVTAALWLRCEIRRAGDAELAIAVPGPHGGNTGPQADSVYYSDRLILLGADQ